MKPQKRTVWAATAAILLLGSVGTLGAQAGSFYQRVSSRLQNNGFTRVRQIDHGWLDARGTATFSVWLTAGSRNVLAGACDEDCSDLDLQLFAPNGTRVDADLLEDDEPMVSVVPLRSGEYRVRVTMPRCSSEPCEYVVGLFRR